MKKLLSVALVGLAACTTPESIKDRPVDWTADYTVSWETMANCLQSEFPSSIVSPRYNQRNKTAALTISAQGIIAPGPVVAEYQVSQGESDDRSRVSQKSWAGGTFPGRKIADRCGAS